MLTTFHGITNYNKHIIRYQFGAFIYQCVKNERENQM